jgi:hypothetical protein
MVAFVVMVRHGYGRAAALFALVLVLQRAGVPAPGIGAAQALVAGGGLAGALLTPLVRRMLTPYRLVGLCWTMTVGVLVCAVLPAGLWMVPPLAVTMLLGPALNATLFAYQTEVTPDRLHGRVISVIIFVATVTNPIAPAVAGLLVERADPAVVFVAFAACLAAAAALATFAPGMRGIRTRV